jgi:hypothetical protein
MPNLDLSAGIGFAFVQRWFTYSKKSSVGLIFVLKSSCLIAGSLLTEDADTGLINAAEFADVGLVAGVVFVVGAGLVTVVLLFVVVLAGATVVDVCALECNVIADRTTGITKCLIFILFYYVTKLVERCQFILQTDVKKCHF